MNQYHRIGCAALALALIYTLPASATTQNAAQPAKPANGDALDPVTVAQ